MAPAFLTLPRRAFGDRRTSSGTLFPTLDGLRGFAVLLVVLGHMQRGGLDVVPSLSLISGGASGVQLFFVLSSFLLSTPLVAASGAELASVRTWVTYFARRFLRIYPLYTLVLVAGTSVGAWHIALFGPREISIVDHLLLREGAKIMWAIPVEMKFYFVLPLLVAAAFFARRLGAVAALALALALLAASAAAVPPPGPFGTPGIDLAPNLPCFLAGFSAALLRRLWRPTTPRERALLEAIAWVGLGWWAASTLGGRLSLWFGATPSSLTRGVAWALATLAAVDSGLLLSAIFRTAALRLVGIVSFSVYLLHMPIVETLRKVPDWSDPAKIAAILATVLAVSMTSYLVVEFPFLELGRRLSRPRSRAPEPPSRGLHPGST